MKYLFTLALLLLLSFNVFAQDSTAVSGVIKISGKITGEENKPVSGANLVLEGTIDGATSDDKGMFEFETEKTGTVRLLVTMMDYSNHMQELNLVAGTNITLDIKLKKSETTTEQILVTASSFTSGENSKDIKIAKEIDKLKY